MEKIEKNERILVTFALFAYNQEKFIREALEGAFSQTYSPLEIILSDDCSTDRTFEIMQEIVKDYEGQHQVILNRNEKNRGIGSHVNKLFSIANGELVVMAAGDDISFPERTEVIVENWLKYNKPSALQSSFSRINSLGEEHVGNYPHIKNHVYEEPTYENLLIRSKGKESLKFFGAASAYSKSCICKFGLLPDYVIAEDAMLAFRALFLRGILHIKDILVNYRIHENSLTNDDFWGRNGLSPIQFEKEFSERRKIFLSIYSSILHDLRSALKLGYVDNIKFELLENAILRKIEVVESIINWWGTNYLIRISKLYKKIILDGSEKEKKWAQVRFIPLPLFVLWRYAKMLYYRLRYFAFN